MAPLRWGEKNNAGDGILSATLPSCRTTMSTTNDAAEFKQQLHDSEAQLAQMARDYPDLPPGQQRECMARLEQTVRLLVRIHNDLMAAERRRAGLSTVAEEEEEDDDPKGANAVQVLGLESVRGLGNESLHASIRKAMAASSSSSSASLPTSAAKRFPDDFYVRVEKNHTADAQGRLTQADEFFVYFPTREDAGVALGLELSAMFVDVGCGNFRIRFAKPARDAATRMLWRSIGEQVERVRAIDAELTRMGAVREFGDGVPKLPDAFFDRAYFLHPKCMPEWKRVRAAGGSLGHHAYATLRACTPVDAAQLSARVKELHDEQCDLLIRLREHQIAGLVFCF